MRFFSGDFLWRIKCARVCLCEYTSVLVAFQPSTPAARTPDEFPGPLGPGLLIFKISLPDQALASKRCSSIQRHHVSRLTYFLTPSTKEQCSSVPSVETKMFRLLKTDRSILHKLLGREETTTLNAGGLFLYLKKLIALPS